MEKEITSTDYQLPPLELLNEYASDGNVVPEEEITGKKMLSVRLSRTARYMSRTSKPYQGRR